MNHAWRGGGGHLIVTVRDNGKGGGSKKCDITLSNKENSIYIANKQSKF